jgi:glutathione S-transferase
VRAGTLYPSHDLLLACKVDALMDQCTDMMVGRRVYKYKARFGFPEAIFTPETTRSIETTWRDDTLQRHFGFFQKCLAESSTGWLAGTAAPTVADILLAVVLKTDVSSAAPLPPKLLELVEAVYALPAVKAFKAAEAAKH